MFWTKVSWFPGHNVPVYLLFYFCWMAVWRREGARQERETFPIIWNTNHEPVKSIWQQSCKRGLWIFDKIKQSIWSWDVCSQIVSINFSILVYRTFLQRSFKEHFRNERWPLPLHYCCSFSECLFFSNLKEAIVVASDCDYESRSRQTSLTGLPGIAGLTEYTLC